MIWLIGNKGMLGSEIQKQLSENKLPFVGTDREVDITSSEVLEAFATSVDTSSYFPSDLPRSERKIKWIINCSAYTNVDKAEDEPEFAAKLNKDGPCNIARVARKIGAKLIHISTDYVFDGQSTIPYTENSEKNPINIYGKSKLAGETAIQKEMNQYYIIRTSLLYGSSGNDEVSQIIKTYNEKSVLKSSRNQIFTPTYAGNLASVIIKIIQKSENAKVFFGKNSALSYGIYNYTDGGETSWEDFAKEIYEIGRKNRKITTDCKLNFKTNSKTENKNNKKNESCEKDALIPYFCLLSKEKICKELKVKLPDWKSELEKYIKTTDFCQE